MPRTLLFRITRHVLGVFIVVCMYASFKNCCISLLTSCSTKLLQEQRAQCDTLLSEIRSQVCICAAVGLPRVTEQFTLPCTSSLETGNQSSEQLPSYFNDYVNHAGGGRSAAGRDAADVGPARECLVCSMVVAWRCCVLDGGSMVVLWARW